MYEFTKSILNLSSLQKDWNHRGAEAPSRESIVRAELVSKSLASLDFPPVKVVPSAAGGVAVIFASDHQKYADIECLNDLSIVASYTDRRDLVRAWEITDDQLSVPELWRVTKDLREFVNADSAA